MNKVSIIALLTCASFAPVAMAEHQNGSISGDWFSSVHFTGFIFDSSCQISNSDKDKIVKLPAVKHSDVKTGEQKNHAIPFTIRIHGCKTFNNIGPNIALDRNSENTTKDGYLKNTASGPKDIAFLLMNDQKEPLDLKHITYHKPVGQMGYSDNDALFYKFHVGYIKLDNTSEKSSTAGPVVAQMHYRITYK